LVDPLNQGTDDVFARGEEGNGIGPDEGVEIGDNNLSVGELALEDTVNQLDALVEVALEALQGEDRAAAQEAVEHLHDFAQRQYKNIDLQTTVSRLEKAEEVGQDAEALE